MPAKRNKPTLKVSNDEIIQLSLKLPSHLKILLEQRSKENFRSQQKEIISILSQVLENKSA